MLLRDWTRNVERIDDHQLRIEARLESVVGNGHREIVGLDGLPEAVIEGCFNRAGEQVLLGAEGAMDQSDVDPDIGCDVAQRRRLIGVPGEA